ncbi:MAG: LacI family transcriptional regulator [Treponema sp.]|nr:LacI family transcriptional regulator [Treponema sp.]
MAGITIYDIAREAGVSTSTVSRVLSNKASISDETKQIINKIVKKYNFKPNAAAQSLNIGTRIIGLMVSDIRSGYFSSLTVACEEAASSRGYTVLLCNMLNKYSLELDHLEKLYAQRVEAIIQLGRRTDDIISDPSYVKHVRAITQNIPFITSGKLDGVDYYSVKMNHTLAIRIVIDYLMSLGHRKIAFIGGEEKSLSIYEKKIEYIRMMKEYNIKLPREFFQEGSYNMPSGYNCMERLLKLAAKPSAVIAVNDECAIGAIHALKRHGLSVPDDMSVVGCDNTVFSQFTWPQLTTVEYNYPLFGDSLVNTAILAAQKKNPPRETILTPSLVVRESCRAL